MNNKLKEYRERAGMTQRELATITSVPIRNIKAYERGQVCIKNATAITVYKLAHTLGITVEDLLIG